MTKIEVRYLARSYVAALCTHQDLPDWALDAGVQSELLGEFKKELLRIASRLERSINPEFKSQQDGSPPRFQK